MANTNVHSRKVVLITGASDGLGLEAAKAYAKASFTVVLAGRTPEKVNKAAEAIKKLTNDSHQNQQVYTLCFDFSSLQSVREAASDFLALNLPLHILINNAGITTTSYGFTNDSKLFEKTTMINMVGPLLFTELLIPRIRESGGGRILIVASNLHNPKEQHIGQKKKDPSRLVLPLDNLDGSKLWSPSDAYSASKLADLWWAYVLAEKLANTDPKITVNAFCPGFVPTTGLGREYPWALRMAARYTFPLVFSNTLTADESAKRYLAYGTDTNFDNDNGAYYRHGEKVESSEESHDMVKARTVYNMACEVAGISESKVPA